MTAIVSPRVTWASRIRVFSVTPGATAGTILGENYKKCGCFEFRPRLEDQHPLVLSLDIARGVEQDLPQSREPDVDHRIETRVLGKPPLLE